MNTRTRRYVSDEWDHFLAAQATTEGMPESRQEMMADVIHRHFPGTTVVGLS